MMLEDKAVGMPDGIGQWLALADKMLHLGYEIAGSAGPDIKRNDDQSDIRLITVLLVARSLSNLRGVISMVKERRIVEARVLARCILENQLWAAGLAEPPVKFRQALFSNDIKKRGMKGEALFKSCDIPDEVEQKIRRWMRENRGWKNEKTIDPKQIARDADMGKAYVLYDYLSTDAHPTINALNRYMTSRDGLAINEIDLDPKPSESEIAETVGLGCYGLICVLVSGCKILESQAAESVDFLVREYLEMMRALP